MSEKRSESRSVVKFNGVKSNLLDDAVSVEEPLQITLDGCPIAVVMRTPCDDAELVRGFLLTEGIVASVDSISRVDLDQKKNHALVFLKDGVEVDHARLQRNLYSASSCGICGKASIESIQLNYPEVNSDFFIPCSKVLELPDRLREAQQVFGKTGGLHAAALINQECKVLVLREDVGRHNAIDKVIGWAASEGIDFSKTLLQLSGRVSFEVMQKALSVGIPVVSAISAPTSLAVDFAKESGQTLIGFLRPPTFNCYAGGTRIA